MLIGPFWKKELNRHFFLLEILDKKVYFAIIIA